MKKFLGMMLFAGLVAFNLQAQELWKEGTHFTVIADEASAEKNITEFFSFWCPHCYNFEPLVAEMKNKKPEDVKFEKVHVNFMGSAGPDVQDAATKAMMVGRVLGKEAEAMNAIFEHIHKDRKLIAGEQDLQQIFARIGVSAEQFNKAYKSFGVNSQFKKNNKIMQEFRRHVSGVPNFIVNGKYQANFVRGMTADDIVDLVVWLSTQD